MILPSFLWVAMALSQPAEAVIGVTPSPVATLASCLPFGFQVTGTTRSTSGAARVVNMRGNLSLARGETLQNVWIVAYDANDREVSRAQGSFDVSRGRWWGGVGDFRLVHFRAVFRVSTASGDRYYRTSRRTW